MIGILGISILSSAIMQIALYTDGEAGRGAPLRPRDRGTSEDDSFGEVIHEDGGKV
jgi:hypothetical protein